MVDNRPRRILDQHHQISNPEHSDSNTRMPILEKSRNKTFNAMLINLSYFEKYRNRLIEFFDIRNAEIWVHLTKYLHLSNKLVRKWQAMTYLSLGMASSICFVCKFDDCWSELGFFAFLVRVIGPMNLTKDAKQMKSDQQSCILIRTKWMRPSLRTNRS